MNSNEQRSQKKSDRKSFLKTILRGGAAFVTAVIGLSAGIFTIAGKSEIREHVWQIDPDKCTQCGNCATECVMAHSAVKCVHAYDVCGYCDLCGGYLRTDATALSTGAENVLCPTAAIKRRYIEEPYFEYTITEHLCIGCGRCVKGCAAFGNGSFFLQIRHDRCLNCNECSIATACPANAIKRVPAATPYILKGKYNNQS